MADAGSKLSLASTKAQASWHCVAPASAASITPVRPEEAGPTISLNAPRGSPPVSASSAKTPVGTNSGVDFSRSNNVDDRCSPSADSTRARSGVVDGMKTSEMTDGEAATFAFYSPLADRILRLGRELVNPLQSRFWSGFGSLCKFVIIRKLPPEWRYRLGVRTEDSQSSNPGSIPGSATN